MNLIFLTLARITDIEQRGIYSDLMRKFRDEGHEVYIVCPCERRLGKDTSLTIEKGVHILDVRTLNIQKTNVVEKGVGILLLERQYQVAIKKYLKDVRFDLIIYSTPPITFTNVVKYLKKQNSEAISYLLLKDIFPQNAVDLGMMTKTGVKGILYRYFRNKEKKLYQCSDYIGCMSPANVEFVLKHNPEISPEKVEIAPNSLELSKKESEPEQVKAEKFYISKKYDLPIDIPIFIYGGNLGKPQGIDFLVKCLDSIKDRRDCYFVVIGNGTEFTKLLVWYEEKQPHSVKVMSGLPKEDYDTLVKGCNVGLIFLDNRFTIPNYPSRLLSYLENKMPVICATDVNTDIGPIAEKNNYGYWCESRNPADFTTLVDKMLQSDIRQMGENGYKFLCQNYLVDHTYMAIIQHFN